MRTKKINQLLSVIIIMATMLSCTALKGTQTGKNGSYTFEINRTKSVNDPVIYGSITEVDPNRKLKIGVVKVDLKHIYHADADGNFTFKVKPGKHRFRGLNINYKQVETKYLNTFKGDSIKLVFKLNQDDTPLY
ncbi:hypothetical protein H7F33_10205 [Pedobacter sp. PAMC26386]|nr:hypothetical protein H7F33_10205 [Pedobacter sp. PAMC26386]